MSLYICSLKAQPDQTIPNNGSYHIVRFPFDDESADPWDMHPTVQPDGSIITNWATDSRSGLIWPAVSGWGTLLAMAYWAPGDQTEIRDRFVRSPLNSNYDSTATEDHALTPGGQYRHKMHQIFVNPATPLGYLVKATGPSSEYTLMFAEFKLAIETDVAKNPINSPF